MAIISSYDPGAPDASIWAYLEVDGGIEQWGQTFVGTGQAVTAVKGKFRTQGSGFGGEIYAQIYNTSGGLPTSAFHGSAYGPLSVGSLSGSYTMLTIPNYYAGTVTPANGTTYALTFFISNLSGTWDGSNHVRAGATAGASGAGHSGQQVYYQSSAWHAQSLQDMHFELLAADAVKQVIYQPRQAVVRASNY